MDFRLIHTLSHFMTFIFCNAHFATRKGSENFNFFVQIFTNAIQLMLFTDLILQYSTAMSKVNRIIVKDISNQNKYSIENIFVYTPHEIYESQHTFMTYVIKCLNEKQNALIQSPTGTGKTMSLLCSTIAWALQQQQISKQPPPQIVYASRTHSQLKQVVGEIKKLCYQIKISILSSRDHCCSNEDLKLLRGPDKELQCRIRVAQRKGLSCPNYKSQAYYSKQAELGKLMDLQDVTLRGKIQGFCPFYYERYSRALSNIVLVPYNYLFDKKIWSAEDGFRLEGSILILDEAHNIQSCCEQYREYSINLSTFVRATQQAQELRFQKLNENKNKIDPGQLDKIKMMKVNLEDIEINAAYIQLIYEKLQTLDISTDSTGTIYSAMEFAEILDKATQPSQFGTLSKNIQAMIISFQNIRTDMMYTPFWALESWMRFIEKLQELINGKGSQRVGISQYAIQVYYEGADIKINIHCLDPSSGFKEVLQQHKPRSIILTSGTLSPLKVWPLELGVQFAQPVSCSHVLSPEQVNTVILGVGPSGQPLDTKYDNRKHSRLYEDIGQALYQIVKYTPNGVVALFPSYSFLEQTKNHLTTLKVMTKLYECKNVYFERKQTADFTTTLERYMKEAQTEKGALLFALVRGRVSQGLDFAQKKCRAVVLVGVPYPCSKDVKIVAKMNYLDSITKKGEKTLTGSQWYLSETVRAVNQGIGRLIRTPDDYGSIYFLDARFAKPDIQAQIASWAKMSLFKPATFADFKKRIMEFNKVNQNNRLSAIQSEVSFVSTNGTVFGPQGPVNMPKKVRGTISRQSQKSIVDQLAEDRKKDMSLQELISSIKTEKQIKDEIKQKEEDDIQQKLERQERLKIEYERNLFLRKMKPLQIKKETCPVCQMQAHMVKSNTCQHSLCQQCWDKWLNQDLRCPICRGRVRKNFLVPET